MTFIQALLIGLIAGLTVLDGNWLGEAKFREPCCTGFLVGLALGDVTKGLKVGAELQLLWMGATGIGPTAQLDIGTGGTIGAAVAIMTGKGAETAILFGVPVAVVMQFINTLLIASYSGLMHKVDNDIEAGNFKSIALTHHFCNWATFALYSLVAFVAMYFGHGVIQAIADGLPAWANAGLNGVAALLPALGFALLLNIIFEKDLTPYLIIGFVLAAYAGQAITMVGITLIAFAIAMIIYQIRSNQGTVVQSASALDDEWED